MGTRGLSEGDKGHRLAMARGSEHWLQALAFRVELRPKTMTHA
jgi:hypothetical protein